MDSPTPGGPVPAGVATSPLMDDSGFENPTFGYGSAPAKAEARHSRRHSKRASAYDLGVGHTSSAGRFRGLWHSNRPMAVFFLVLCVLIVLVIIAGVVAGVLWYQHHYGDNTPHYDGGWRLPRYVTPHHYDLHIYPDIDARRFSGTVVIRGTVTEATRVVVLHARNITITSTAVSFTRNGTITGSSRGRTPTNSRETRAHSAAGRGDINVRMAPTVTHPWGEEHHAATLGMRSSHGGSYGDGRRENAGVAVGVDHVQMVTAFDNVALHLAEEVPSAGEIVLTLGFEGALYEKLYGLYLSSYEETSGNSSATMYMVSTQMEPAAAREAFPCFDEPGYKATFDIAITARRNHTVLSNGDVLTRVSRAQTYGVRSETGGGVATGVNADANDTEVVVFERTPAMSTYLVAMVVGPLTYVENMTSGAAGGRAVRVRVYGRTTASGQLALPAAFGAECLDYYEGRYNVSYPLTKLDMVAIPDFAMGAMENWGLVTYRESDLLVDPATASASSLQRALEVIAHELAHQWFGNLVTMEWWNGLWLNEGFARFTQYYGVANSHDDWEMHQQFVVRAVTAGLEADASEASHPIIDNEAETPEEIDALFDGISYDKGASLIRMLQSVIGAEAFNRGITAYLNKFSFQSAVTTDLWDALQKASGNATDVAKMMETWTNEKHYPVVVVADDGLLYQTRFLFEAIPNATPVTTRGGGGAVRSDPTDPAEVAMPVWMVPVALEFDNGTSFSVTITNTSGTAPPAPYSLQPSGALPAYNASEGRWLKANSGQNGFFPVLYADAAWAALVAALCNSTKTGSAVPPLAAVDRAGALQDAFLLTHAGTYEAHVPPGTPTQTVRATATRALDAAACLSSERHYAPWRAAASGLSRISLLRGFDKNWSSFVASVVGPAAEAYGWGHGVPAGVNVSEHVADLVRAVVLPLAAEHGDAHAAAEAKRLYEAEKNATGSVNPSVLSAVLSTAVREGVAGAFDFVLNRYDATVVAAEKVVYLNALSGPPDAATRERVLQYTLDGRIPPQDIRKTLIHLAYLPPAVDTHRATPLTAADVAWSWVEQHWDAYVAKVPTMGPVVSGIAAAFTTSAQWSQAQTFLASVGYSLQGQYGRSAAAAVDVNRRWLQTSNAEVTAWLNARG
eukprot:TRINITY_DN3186_c0_g1_i1.p1 TRINITY_DN3186_c0_g1~~TRINITY_DN3186_c0_g1_i1.p1  ORF type:complete len:1136 (+),score=268.54 TRINITY_DN3186_c0_g1_i1:47-3454(+)